MKLKILQEYANEKYFMAVYIQEHRTVFFGETVAPSDAKAIVNYGYQLREHLRSNRWNIPKGTNRKIRLFHTQEERDEFKSKFNNQRRI